MSYPKPKTANSEIDLKLGIKSSLPNATQAIVLSYLIWKCGDKNSQIAYSKQNGDGLVLEDELSEKIAGLLQNNVEQFNKSTFNSHILNNPLLKAQIEALIVGFELVWKLARFNFVDKSFAFNAERTGGKRFEKIISYTSNIDILDLLVQSNEKVFLQFFYEVLTESEISNKVVFDSFRKLLTVFSETAVYKIEQGGNDLIFDNLGVYKSLLEDNTVNLSDDKENKGSSRILKSSANEGLNYYLTGSVGVFTKNQNLAENELKSYSERVENFLALTKIKVSFDDKTKVESDNSSDKLTTTASYKNSWSQNILYGVPGSGKSYAIKKLLVQNNILRENTVRVVFHPEYTNSDFIGQILPKLKEKNGENMIDYQFTAGAFTKILREAYCNPETNYALIIEEINRGNAAAIFGELFQLLDRLDEDDTEPYNGVTYTKGWSAYGVHNDCMNAFLRGLYDEEGAEEKQPAIHFDENSAIRLPANLSLFATMNTSDQNVFSLDNAFKRRWDLSLIPNKFVFDSENTEENRKSIEQCFAEVEDFDFYWGAFVEAINKKIIEEQSGADISSFEDKQIGIWFIKSETGVIPKAKFLYKVIEYLWDDVFKLDTTVIFNGIFKSLSELITNADSQLKNIFKAEFITLIQNESLALENQLPTTQQHSVKESRRGKRINFTDLNIPVGSELTMTRNNQKYVCKVLDEKAVSLIINGIEEKHSTLTSATCKILGTPKGTSPGQVSGLWSYSGKTLLEL